MENLQKIRKKLEEISKSQYFEKVYFPSNWSMSTKENKLIHTDPTLFFMEQIDWIILNGVVKSGASTEQIIYNFLPRFTTTFDHNQDNNINNIEGQFKETGTFLKSIAILPYLYKLGINTVYLLPVSAIGIDGRKGNLGSPYSILNPYKLDNNLSEPLLELSVEEEFRAFIEAAHFLGIKVIVEFVFRTASKDSELIFKHPEWFYWIKESVDEFHSPKFEESELVKIKEKVSNNDFTNLPPPDKNYINLYSSPPVKLEKQNNGMIIGETSDGEKVKIPGAFADWPPDDIQPAWSDVTYLKLYNSSKFNYIAYNTIRMYDEELILEEYETKDLWHHIENIIPYYQKTFGIDGVMIDMGHSLPEKLMTNIIKKAKDTEPNFIFWEENFVPNKESLAKGFNAVLGYLPFDEHDYYKMQNVIRVLENKEFPIPCFATGETHNTPRTASRISNPKYIKKYNELIYAINTMLPLPLFIHSGFELCEVFPVNTGLGFENIDTSSYSINKLALFSIAELNWTTENNIIESVTKLNKIKYNYFDAASGEIELLGSNLENILFFRREDKHKNWIYFVGNYSDVAQEIKITIIEKNNLHTNKLIDILTNEVFDINIKSDIEPDLDSELELNLAPWDYKILTRL